MRISDWSSDVCSSDLHRILSFDESGTAGERLLLYIDRTVLNEYTSPQAFSGLRAAGRAVWRPAASLGVVDHVNSTNPDRAAGELDDGARRQIEYLGENGRDFGIEIFDLFDPRQGIEHVVMPELGLVLPGMVIAAGDSHSTTYGARSEEHTSELQSLMRISYAVFCLKKKKKNKTQTQTNYITTATTE